MSEGTLIDSGAGSDRERLLVALIEQLKSPLLHLARGAELSRMVSGTEHQEAILTNMELVAAGAMTLLDNYLLSRQIDTSQIALRLEPIAVSSVLSDSAHALEAFARQHECEVRVDAHVNSAYPVMAHAEGLQAALVTLGQAFIEAQQAREAKTDRVITLGAHRTRYGIVTGVFANMDGLNADIFKRARSLYGTARTPLPEVSAGSGAAVFIADSLFEAMATPLKVAKHRHLGGLAATLNPSQQLLLV